MILESKEKSLEVLCNPDDYRLDEFICPLHASDFLQLVDSSRLQIYNAYIEDSPGNISNSTTLEKIPFTL